MTKTIYGIYDKVFKEFVQVVLLDDNSVKGYFSGFCNDITNPYFSNLSDLELYKLCYIDDLTSSDTYFCPVSDFIDDSIRNLQIITKTLNFLPNGYFKMPKEMQEDIEKQIKECVYSYVANYLSNDEKFAISKVVSSESEGSDDE